MIGLLAAGFGALVLGLNLMIIRLVLHLTGATPAASVDELKTTATVVIIVGCVVLIVGIIRLLVTKLSSENALILSTGVSVAILGFAALIRATGDGHEHTVLVGAWVATGIGIALILAYSLAVYVFHRK